MTQPNKDTSPEDEKPTGGVFNPNEYDWPKHLKTALDDLKLKKLDIDRAWNYYDGEHPKVWLTDAIKDKLDDELIVNMAENWCDVAVDGPVRRLTVEGFTDRGRESEELENDVVMAEAATNVWKDNDLRLGQKDVYTAATVAGESFVFVWKDDDKKTGLDTTIKDARNVWWPKDCHRADPTRVVLVWADEDEGVWRATCYYRYVVVRLVGPQLKNGGTVMPSDMRWWNVDPADPGGEHGFEKVPVIRFSLSSARRSHINRIRTFQDKINKLAANMLVNAEFNAFRKMAILTEQVIDDETLKMRPNRISVLDPGGGEGGAAPTSIWESSETDLSNYSDEQDKLIDKLFTKSWLPGHLKVKSEKVAPSGAAYEADEGPFTEYIEDLQTSYGESWHDMYELMLGLDVECQWRDPHVKSEATIGTTVKALVDAGVPISLALKYYAGWTTKQIEELENAPLSPKEQLAMAASQALAEGGGMADTDNPKAQPPGTDTPKAGNLPAQQKATSGKPVS